MRSGSDFFQKFARVAAAKGGAKFLPEPVNFRFPHIAQHMGREHASREKKLPLVLFFIFVHKNVYRIRFKKIKIGPLEGFEKKAFSHFYS